MTPRSRLSRRRPQFARWFTCDESRSWPRRGAGRTRRRGRSGQHRASRLERAVGRRDPQLPSTRSRKSALVPPMTPMIVTSPPHGIACRSDRTSYGSRAHEQHARRPRARRRAPRGRAQAASRSNDRRDKRDRAHDKRRAANRSRPAERTRAGPVSIRPADDQADQAAAKDQPSGVRQGASAGVRLRSPPPRGVERAAPARRMVISRPTTRRSPWRRRSPRRRAAPSTP